MREIMGGGKVFWGGAPASGGTGFLPPGPGAGQQSTADKTRGSVNSLFGALGTDLSMFGQLVNQLGMIGKGDWIRQAVDPLKRFAAEQPTPQWPMPMGPQKEMPNFDMPRAENKPPSWMDDYESGFGASRRRGFGMF